MTCYPACYFGCPGSPVPTVEQLALRRAEVTGETPAQALAALTDTALSRRRQNRQKSSVDYGPASGGGTP